MTKLLLALLCAVSLLGCTEEAQCIRSHEITYMVMTPVYNGTQLMTFIPTWYTDNVCDERVKTGETK